MNDRSVYPDCKTSQQFIFISNTTNECETYRERMKRWFCHTIITSLSLRNFAAWNVARMSQYHYCGGWLFAVVFVKAWVWHRNIIQSRSSRSPILEVTDHRSWSNENTWGDLAFFTANRKDGQEHVVIAKKWWVGFRSAFAAILVSVCERTFP